MDISRAIPRFERNLARSKKAVIGLVKSQLDLNDSVTPQRTYGAEFPEDTAKILGFRILPIVKTHSDDNFFLNDCNKGLPVEN